MPEGARPPVSATPRLLDRVRDALRLGHYSPRTEDAYAGWIRRFILYHGKRHPSEMGANEVVQFLTHLAVDGQVSGSTQNQALAAVLFLYGHVLKQEIGDLGPVVRGHVTQRLPVVLTRSEVRAVMGCLRGVPWMIVSLLYGAGLRLNECLDIRVKDIDLEREQIMIRRGKGDKDRPVPLPRVVRERLLEHLETVRRLHQRDLAAGFGAVVLPDGLARKYPHAATSWPWQFVFPAGRICRDARWGGPTRYRLHETAIQREVVRAVRDAGLSKRASCHTFRHHADSRIMPMSIAS